MERITSRKNKIIVHLRELGSEKKYRQQCGEFLCDGLKLLNEAVSFGAEITAVLWKGTAQEATLPANCPQYEAPEDLFDYASPMKNSPGPLFTVRIRPDSGQPFSNALVLENVQDPGNVGTVLRTANAFGVDAVVLVGACADLYSPKTVRSTMGAVFRQRAITLAGPGELKELLAQTGLKLYGAALRDDAEDIRNVDIRKAAVAVGSEGKGLSQELLSLCDASVIIPMQPQSESLNAAVAASVIMWEMAR